MSRRLLMILATGVGLLAACSDGSYGSRDDDHSSSGSAGSGGSDKLRCGDFLTTADVKALGIDASKYDEDGTEDRPGYGVQCWLDDAPATIFHGDAFDTLVSTYDSAIEDGTLMMETGPTIGKESHWASQSAQMSSWPSKRTSVMFLATSGTYAAAVVSSDKGLTTKIAKKLDTKF